MGPVPRVRQGSGQCPQCLILPRQAGEARAGSCRPVLGKKPPYGLGRKFAEILTETAGHASYPMVPELQHSLMAAAGNLPVHLCSRSQDFQVAEMPPQRRAHVTQKNCQWNTIKIEYMSQVDLESSG